MHMHEGTRSRIVRKCERCMVYEMHDLNCVNECMQYNVCMNATHTNCAA